MPHINGTIYLYILSFCLGATLFWASLWLNRRRIMRQILRKWLGKGFRGIASSKLTYARQQRIINAKDEAALRSEFGLEDLQ